LVKFVDDFIVTADLRCPFGSRDSTTSLALLPKPTAILPTAAKQSFTSAGKVRSVISLRR
jgi:hypothetical protein